METPAGYIEQLSETGDVIRCLYRNLNATDYLWRPAPEKWNLLEIICHLYDEEREDFRHRLRSVLDDPERPFDPIDPANWVHSRRYSDRELNEVLPAFLEERKASLTWLKGLDQAPWDNTHLHPRIGPMSAKYILANWVAHDLLHIRQVIKLKYDLLRSGSGESLAYAGDW